MPLLSAVLFQRELRRFPSSSVSPTPALIRACSTAVSTIPWIIALRSVVSSSTTGSTKGTAE